MAPSMTVLSCQPSSGTFGTRVFAKFTSHYDFFSMSSPMPYLSISFGSQRCAAQEVTRESQDSNGFIYSCNVDAPQLLVTGCNSSNVPLSLVIDGPSGEDLSRAGAGSFQYLEGPGDEDSITRTAKVPKHETAAPAPRMDQPATSPKSEDATEGATNTYDYPTAQQEQYANTFPQNHNNNNNEMITAYRSSSFADPPHYHRRPGGSTAWSGFGSALGSSTGRSPALGHVGTGSRHSMTPLTMPSTNGSSSSSSAPQLVRTSTISNGPGSAGGYHPMSLYSSKAVLKINGQLNSMAQDWNAEEWDNKRRIVMFRKSQTGSTLNASFRAVSVNDRPTNSICVSCIWWAEKGDCYVTSVDTILLLEQLVAAPNRFSVEEKNRIRRNLEGFHPKTVSKAKADSEEFFKIIMGFPNPKPRNIEKDVKVFPWKTLEQALKKIIGKYSASPSSTLPPASIMTSLPYAPLPTPPGHGLSSQQSLSSSHHNDPYSQSSLHSNGHDAMPSPRSLSGSQPSWANYSTGPSYSSISTRTLSPNLRHTSPHQQSSMRINTNTLPAVSTISAYDTRAVSNGTYSSTGLHTPISHHPSTTTPPRWDSVSSGYHDGYSTLGAHHSHAVQPVYGAAAYGDGSSRA